MCQQQHQVQECKVSQLCSNVQRETKEYYKNIGNDNYQHKIYLEALTSNVEKQISWSTQTMIHKINGKEIVSDNIMKLRHQHAISTTRNIENSERLLTADLNALEKTLHEKIQTMANIYSRQHFFQSTLTTDQIEQSLEQTITKQDTFDKDSCIKRSLLLDQESTLSKFIGDLLKNLERHRPIWSESTLNLFSLLLNYGGPATVKLIKSNLGGPSISHVYVQARQTTPIETSLSELSFQAASRFSQNILAGPDLRSIMFSVAIDATPVLPLVRAKGNELLGFATNSKINVYTADDIIQAFKNKELTKVQQTYVIVLVPLRSDIPYYILAAPPVIKGENHRTVLEWLRKCKQWGNLHGLNIFGLGADGDSKIRSFYLNWYLKDNDNENRFSIDRRDFTFGLPVDDETCLDCPFPDPDIY